ncbi:MAG: aquaporin family protein [Opitutaceae bacterium]|nr:aquaporin family protein [Opitutaceae bacterium]
MTIDTQTHHKNDLLGEFIGTFILVFFGCGSVAVAVLFSAFSGLFQIASVWGIGVALAIYASRHLSNAHLNPAVSVAMVIAGRMSFRELLSYLVGQFLGAFMAAVVLYILFNSSIVQFEALNGIVRGSVESVKTAMLFGEFYPNPGNEIAGNVSTMNAIYGEAFGTFLLVFFIFSLTEGCNVGQPDSSLAPLFIGGAVAIIISIIAPLTQAGLNPARDLAPRIFSMFAGWGQAAFPDDHYGFLTVYVLAPIGGGILAALLFKKIVQPMVEKKQRALSGAKNL